MGIFDALSGITDSGNHDSILGNLGKQFQKYTDPIAMIPGFGDKWTNLTSVEIPRMSNTALSKVVTPFDRVDETINPVRQIPIVDKVGDVVRDKPASAIGTAVGSFFAAPAIGSAMGIGGAGGAGGAGAGTVGSGLSGGGAAAGYGGGVSSSVLPGIFPGATVAPEGVAGAGSFGGSAGGLGAFGGGIGTGSITGAGSEGGLGLNSGGLDWMQMAQQGQKLLGNGQQQQQPTHRPPEMAGGGGGNMRGLFSSLVRNSTPRHVNPTTGLLGNIWGQ